jgi:hypothetical protein
MVDGMLSGDWRVDFLDKCPYHHHLANKKMKLQLLPIALGFLLYALPVTAQLDRNDPLFLELKRQDSIFFERGFNRCDVDYLAGHVASDLRFYHDQSGFQDRERFLKNTQQYICSNSNKKPIRRIDTSSLQVFPLYDAGQLYAVLQTGIHHFYLREWGKEDKWSSTAKFAHVWVIEQGGWLLSEVISYDHQAP